MATILEISSQQSTNGLFWTRHMVWLLVLQNQHQNSLDSVSHLISSNYLLCIDLLSVNCMKEILMGRETGRFSFVSPSNFANIFLFGNVSGFFMVPHLQVITLFTCHCIPSWSNKLTIKNININTVNAPPLLYPCYSEECCTNYV